MQNFLIEYRCNAGTFRTSIMADTPKRARDLARMLLIPSDGTLVRCEAKPTLPT